MNRNLKKIKLSEKDKKILFSNSNICTDLHGSNCDVLLLSKVKSNLDLN